MCSYFDVVPLQARTGGNNATYIHSSKCILEDVATLNPTITHKENGHVLPVGTPLLCQSDIAPLEGQQEPRGAVSLSAQMQRSISIWVAHTMSRMEVLPHLFDSN